MNLHNEPKHFTVAVASKTRHAHMWQIMRADGVDIISTWIDDPKATFGRVVVDRWFHEATLANRFVFYMEPDEQAPGALAMLGTRIGAGKMAVALSPDPDKAFGHNLFRHSSIYCTRNATAAFGSQPFNARVPAGWVGTDLELLLVKHGLKVSLVGGAYMVENESRSYQFNLLFSQHPDMLKRDIIQYFHGGDE